MAIAVSLISSDILFFSKRLNSFSSLIDCFLLCLLLSWKKMCVQFIRIVLCRIFPLIRAHPRIGGVKLSLKNHKPPCKDETLTW